MAQNLIDADAERVIGVNNFRILDGENQLTKESLKNSLKPPYPLGYVFNVILFILGGIIVLLSYYGIIPTHHQGFFCQDPLFSHKYTGNTVTPVMLGLGECLLQLLVFFTEAYGRSKSFRGVFTIPSLAVSYFYLKYFALGLIMIEVTTEMGKGIVGEHRPDFFDVCRPDTNLNCTKGEYVRSFTCTNTEKFSVFDLVDASRSFPSGHSSISWFTAMYFGYMIHTGLPSETAGSLFKFFMIGICILWGALCSLTRITDRRHHWWDVLVGAIVGLLGAAYMIRVTEQKFDQIRRRILLEKSNRRNGYTEEASLEISDLV